jgi:hypothetical protein
MSDQQRLSSKHETICNISLQVKYNFKIDFLTFIDLTAFKLYLFESYDTKEHVMNLSSLFRHKYTGNLICSVPCDDIDDLCLDNADEDCQQKFFLNVLASLFVCILVNIVVGEMVVRYLMSRRAESDWELDSEDPAKIQCLRRFLTEFFSNNSTPKSAKKLFKVTIIMLKHCCNVFLSVKSTTYEST